MALAIVALFAGLWGGLIRLGLPISGIASAAGEAHGPLMALGFLGTLVSLERAVALARPWAYTAPLAAGLGALATIVGAPASLGPALLLLAGCVLAIDHLALHRIAPSLHNGLMGIGALAWCGAAALWLGGADVARFAPLLAGFLVLTIVGERLELTRATRRPASARWFLLLASAIFSGGLALSVTFEPAGVRIAGAGLLGTTVWLARHDIARRTIHSTGLTRFMAVGLLAGYVWLGCAAVLWMTFPAMRDGPAYDAALHSVFLGFVMSMIFAHAPVIVPAVVRVTLPFRRTFYWHLLLLHSSLVLRLIGGDLAGSATLWRWGDILGEVSILAFVVATAFSALAGRRPVHAL